MTGVLIGFAIIAAVILAGYLVGRADLLGPRAPEVLSRLAFFVLMPPLLFTVLAEADARALLSTHLPVAAIAVSVVFVAYLLIALLAWRRPVPDVVVGMLAAGYSNANNIGLPVSLYVLGNAAASVPVILLQLGVIAPIALAVLDVTTSGKASVGRILSQPVRNPVTIAALLGLVCALVGWRPPDPVMAPLELVGAAAVPVVLLAFGMSLSGTRVLQPGSRRRDVVLATVLKLVVMPVVGWAAARFLFGLTGHELFVATVLAALPAGQNVFVFAQRYGRGVVMARDAVLITTVLSIPTLVVVAALLAG